MVKTTSALRQVIWRKDEAFDSLTACDPFHDLGHIRYRDPPVKKVIGLDQNADAARTLVKAARRANARLDLGKPPRAKLFFQRPVHVFRTSSRA